ncbi:MAG: pilus assembly protein TadA, partial [Proteobacteria bacterium]
MSLNPNCNLIAVVGGKGGVGKSVFAANFSIALMAELRTQVMLVDADSRSVGDQNVIMGLKPNKTLKELASMTTSVNAQNMGQFLTMHASGVAYLGAVRGPEETLSISPDLAMKQFEFFSRQFKFIVVDIGTELGPLQMAVLQEATAIMIVTTPEALVVTHTMRLMNELISNTFPKDMFQLVINKASPTGLSPQAIAGQLQLAPIAVIPNDEITAMASLQKYQPFVLGQPKSAITAAYYETVRRLSGGVLQRLKSLARPKAPVPTADAATGGTGTAATSNNALDPRNVLKMRIHSELINIPDLKKILLETNRDEAQEKEVREKIRREITLITDREAPNTARDERSKIIKEVLEESLGLGPLEDLLADPAVTEIMVNGYKKIFVEKMGKVYLSPVTFTTNHHLTKVIERIVQPLGRQINQKTPYVDARLKDGSRVNAVIEPLSIDGPALTIRKFKKGGISAEKYIEFGSVTKPMVDFLRICVENGLNVVISGGTGSGKTSLLNMLSTYIPSNERVITVEDAAELQLQQEHVVRLETRPSSIDESLAVTIRDLIKNALRMRPDRIIVGECRDGAALDMLQAMNTGHDGSMTTTHANSARECLARLETLCLMSGMDLPIRAIREQIAGAVNL